ncbi:MAG: DUF2461 domain-containing protein [Chloroflexi bacterium]|nr:DUF2461 domain-containing protein [Chloroflexota bacterium]
MKSSFDLAPALEFLRALKTHNERPWFEQHRREYERAKASFEALVDAFIAELRSIEDFGDLKADACLYRINRDVRFSKDKSPYKMHFAANVACGGRKSDMLGYYLHIAPDDASLIAGGLYMPSTAQLDAFRRAIDRRAREFKRVVGAKEFIHYFGAIEGVRLKTAPQGYARDHPEIDLLRLKQIVASHSLPDTLVTSDRLLAHVVKAGKALKPFLDYLNQVEGKTK